jgi:eukaryotic-like serine/threonine-protein kinase
MSTSRWARVDRLFSDALDLPEPERAGFLARACGPDEDLRAEVEALLAGVEAAEDYFEARSPGLLLGPSGPLPADPAGATVGVYRVVRELGRGGMSVVYLAERADDLFKRQVALKLLAPVAADDDALRRFARERQILATLSHPGIARLLDARLDAEGRPYLVMERVDGRPIDRHCDEEGLDVEARLELFTRVAEAVEYAHRHLVVHRDLKPSNILVTVDGQVKLLDFGIAKLLEPGGGEEPERTTGAAQRLLTPGYASPEQIRGERITTASDIYQLGVLLYQLLTGRRPFSPGGGGLPDLARSICETEPPPPSRAVLAGGAGEGPGGTGPSPVPARRLRGDLDNIALRALEKEPERRYASVAELREDLHRFRRGLPVHARSPTAAYRAGKFLRRNRFGVAAGAVVAVLGASYLSTTAMQSRRLAAEAARTEQVKDFLVGLFRRANPGASPGGALTALDLVEEGVRRVAAEPDSDPTLRAELLTVLGELLGSLGRYEDAAGQLRQALELRRTALGRWHPETAQTAHALGFSLHHQGRYAEAEGPLREALQVRIRLFGEESREAVLTLDELGDLLHSRGEFAEAEEVLRRAAAVPPDLVGDDVVALVQRHLANVRRDRGAAREAEELYRRSLIASEERLGGVHPVTGLTRSELALLLAETGRHGEAEALLRENLEVYALLYPGGHAMEGTTFRNLGVLRLREGRLAEAREALEEGLRIYARTLPPGHALVPRTRRYLAEALLAMGDIDGAASEAGEVLLQLRAQGLVHHPAMADVLETLGRARLAQGRMTEARDLLSRSLESRLVTSEASDPRLEVTLRWIERAGQEVAGRMASRER